MTTRTITVTPKCFSCHSVQVTAVILFQPLLNSSVPIAAIFPWFPRCFSLVPSCTTTLFTAYFFSLETNDSEDALQPFRIRRTPNEAHREGDVCYHLLVNLSWGSNEHHRLDFLHYLTPQQESADPFESHSFKGLVGR